MVSQHKNDLTFVLKVKQSRFIKKKKKKKKTLKQELILIVLYVLFVFSCIRLSRFKEIQKRLYELKSSYKAF